ncbi:MAG: NUDIX domain-containing protein [Candidatus Saccharibacteria bacterium]
MYPNTFYRVSVKAFITNDKDQILVVRENQDWWDLPGGGLDHGELPKDCLKREIYEELGIKDVHVGEITYTKSMYLDRKDAWLIWIVYKVELNTSNFIYGDGVTDAKYINIQELEDSEDMFEKSVAEVARSVQ